jgi:hypothetical protein
LSAYRYDTVIEPDAVESLPYYFRIDTDPTEWGMVIVVEYFDENNQTYRSLAYRDTVKVVEPALKYWEPQMLFLYALLAGVAYASFLYIKSSLFPEPKSKRVVKQIITPESIQKARGNEGGKVHVENEWIPKHVKDVHSTTSTSPTKSPKRRK